MNIDNQKAYWDSVAQHKTFTHPLNINLLLQYVDKNAVIVDYGCGYGRIIEELQRHQFSKIDGYDTSVELIKRAQQNHLPVHHIATPADLPLADNSVDCFILFAVLTCLPSNKGQTELISLLHSKLKPGGYIYISDYYLQDNEVAKSRYTYYNNDPDNFGVFTLPEGATLRHHTTEWITSLLKNFTTRFEQSIDVTTMNGNRATAFQLVVQK